MPSPPTGPAAQPSAATPEEIDQQIHEAEEAEQVAAELWQRERRLLS
jgi:hypothetical protein